MKKIVIILNLIVIVMLVAAAQAYPQTNVNRVVPGAEAQLINLLNNPTMVKPPIATPLGRNWYSLETDIHVFSDQVSVRQVVDVLTDIENLSKAFDGKKSELTATLVSGSGNNTVVDFVSTAIVIGIRLRTPYRAAVTVETNTDTEFFMSVRQLPQDSETNGKIKNLNSPRYVAEVTINGKKYTYIRMFATTDVDAAILPGARGVLERNAGPTNEEAIALLIAAAKAR